MTREKQQMICKGIPIRLLTDFSAETLNARREWHNTLEVRKGKKKKKANYNQEYSAQQGSHSDLAEK